MALIKKPFKERLKDTAFLFKHSFLILGKSPAVRKPLWHMSVVSVIVTTSVFIALLGIFSGAYVLSGILLLLFTSIILVPFQAFYDVRQKADQSWLAYGVISGKPAEYAEAHARTRAQKGTLRGIAIVDLLVRFASGSRGQRKGIAGAIIAIFLSALVEIWDLASHYLLPAVVIEQKSITESIPQIKALRNNIPATFAGVFGVDFAGDVVNGLLIQLYLFCAAIAVGVGYLIAKTTTQTVITIGTFSFSWVPLLVLTYLLFLVGGIVKKIVTTTKVIYFTVFYTALTRPNSIAPEIRGEVTNYLLVRREGAAATPEAT